MSEWIYRSYIIVAALDRAAANEVAFEVGPGGEAERLTMSVPLSPTGAEPATHYGCSTALTVPMVLGLNARVAAGRIPSAVFFTVDTAGNLVASNNLFAQAKIGQMFDWGQALGSLGLTVITAPTL